MNRTILTLCISIAIITVFSLPAYSAEIYEWIDKQGGKHITDQPPEMPSKMISEYTYTEDSPKEIQRYKAEQKAKEQRREAELLKKQQINRAQKVIRSVTVTSSSRGPCRSSLRKSVR